MLGALCAEGAAPFNHLVQNTHQAGDIGLNGLLVIILCLSGIPFQHFQDLGGGLMNLLMQRLQLGAQGEHGFVFGLGVAVNPLTEGAGSWVDAAGEAASCIEGVAEISGPFVVSGFRALGPFQKGKGLCSCPLNTLDTQNIASGYKAEQQDRCQSRRGTNEHTSFDTFSHQHSYVSSLYNDAAQGMRSL